MSKQLNGRHIAVLATDGFEQSELQEPKRLLEEAGAIVHVIAPDGAKQIKGWDKKDWGSAVNVDKSLDQANVNDYDALVLPGGVINPDKLRLDAKAIALIKAFGAADKPIAAICHGPWTLINAELVDGRKITSWPSRTGRQPHHQPQAGRYPRFHQDADRGDRGVTSAVPAES
jgi:protease I